MGEDKMRTFVDAAWVLPRILGYNAYKLAGWPKLKPIFLTVSVTNTCNSRCKTCGIWRGRRGRPEMTLAEYEKLFENYGRIFWLTVEGGEPFLRKDLADIVIVACRKSRPAWVTIATNGSLSGIVLREVKKMLRKCPRTNFAINVSIDDIGSRHDSIRGMKGSFDKAVRTVRALKKLRNHRLVVGVNTVVSRCNIRNFDEISEYITGKLKPDSYVAEVAEGRAKLGASELSIEPSEKETQRAFSKMSRQCEKSALFGPARLARTEYHKSMAGGNRRNKFEGITSAYIMPGGEVWLSCSKKLVAGNLRDVGYAFSEIWFGRRAAAARRAMQNGYSTTAANAFYSDYVCELRNMPRIAMSLMW